MEIFLIIIVAAFINNAVLVQCYGICPFLGVSKKIGNAFGIGSLEIYSGLIARWTCPLKASFNKWLSYSSASCNSCVPITMVPG